MYVGFISIICSLNCVLRVLLKLIFFEIVRIKILGCNGKDYFLCLYFKGVLEMGNRGWKKNVFNLWD